MQLKLEVPGGGSASIGSFKILNFYTVGARWIKFLEWVDIKNELNLTKIGRATLGGFSSKHVLRNSHFFPFKLNT